MQEFWSSSGYRLLSRDDNGRLAVTDDFLRAYLLRPEIRPVEDSCAAERASASALAIARKRGTGEHGTDRQSDEHSHG